MARKIMSRPMTNQPHTHNQNSNPNGLSGIAALMLDYNDNSDIDITAKSHYSYYQLTTHNSSDKNN